MSVAEVTGLPLEEAILLISKATIRKKIPQIKVSHTACRTHKSLSLATLV